MLICNTVILTPEALGKRRFARTGFSEFTYSLIYDTFQAITSSMTEQSRQRNDLKEVLSLSEEQYALANLEGGDVEEYMDQNPQLDLTFDEAKLLLAKQQLNALKTMASGSVPQIKIDSGTISSSLLFSFSEEENVQQPDGTVLPKTRVRPPSASSAEKRWGGSISGEVKIHFSITNEPHSNDN